MGRLGPHPSPIPSCTLDPREEGTFFPSPVQIQVHRGKMRALRGWAGRGQHTWEAWLREYSLCGFCRSRESHQGPLPDLLHISRAHVRISGRWDPDPRTIRHRCCLYRVLVLKSFLAREPCAGWIWQRVYSRRLRRGMQTLSSPLRLSYPLVSSLLRTLLH